MTEGHSSKNVVKNTNNEKFSSEFYNLTIKEEMEKYEELDIKEEPLDLSTEDYNCKTDSEFEYETDHEPNKHSSNEFNMQRNVEKVKEEEEEQQEEFNLYHKQNKLPQDTFSGQPLPNFDLLGILKEQTLFMKNMTKLMQWRKLRQKKEKDKKAVEEESIKSHSLLQTLLEQSQRKQPKPFQETFLVEGKRKNLDDITEGNCKRLRVAGEIREENSNYTLENIQNVKVKEEPESSGEDEHENMNMHDENKAESSSFIGPDSAALHSNESIQNILAFFMRYPPHVFNSISALLLNDNNHNTNPELKTRSDYEMIRESKYVVNDSSEYEWNTKNSQELISSIRQALSSGMFAKNNSELIPPKTTKPNHHLNQPVPPKNIMSNHGLSPGISKIDSTTNTSCKGADESDPRGLVDKNLLGLKIKRLIAQKSSAITAENLCIDDHTLKSLSVRDFNKRVSLYHIDIQTMLRKRRRTLKNRGYASSCRVKRQVYKQKLESANAILRSQIELHKSKLNKLKVEDPSWNHNSTSINEWVKDIKKEKENPDRKEEEELAKGDDDENDEMDEDQHSLDMQYRKQLEKYFPLKVGTTEEATTGGIFKNYLSFFLRHRTDVAAPNVVLDPYSNTFMNYAQNSAPNNNYTNHGITTTNNDSTTTNNVSTTTNNVSNNSGSSSSSSNSSSSNNNESNNNNYTETSYITDSELLALSVVQLNRRLQKFPKELQQLFKLRRRTLKNRSYAKNCRTRRLINKERLEIINASLRMELETYKAKLSQAGGECDLMTRTRNSWNECLDERDESDNESEESIGKSNSFSKNMNHYSTRSKGIKSGQKVGNKNPSRIEKISFREKEESLRKADESYTFREESLSKEEDESFNNEDSFSEDESLNDWDESVSERRSMDVLSPDVATGMIRTALMKAGKGPLNVATKAISEHGDHEDEEHREYDY